MGQDPDAFPELPRPGQRPALRGMQAGRPAGERDEARDGHVRRRPGSPEAVTGGEDVERRDVFPGALPAFAGPPPAPAESRGRRGSVTRTSMPPARSGCGGARRIRPAASATARPAPASSVRRAALRKPSESLAAAPSLPLA